ncbi:DNA circularization protein [Bergeriella denitrificans]|uniref:Putative phage virion protein n=1 Tax=Bergeriella denitrificans TaxID=494 RepID=A0A378UGJ0_BERDE|nr:DNA circularization N-terminal domain-containing protein [Bergeriella denitrificans]STZ75572.1 putative phage virion protein [Bergeriella denitrificans]
MSSWHTILQDASYKGVGFEVMALDESNGKALVEHARAFTQGVELEDMGTSGRQVQVSAVFYGKQYSSRLLRLLEALEEPGAGVLVHPVWGRLNNMLAASWSYRHDAENVDYATIDVTFREAAEAQKIFVFENHFLMALERLIARIDAYRMAAVGMIDALLAMRQGCSALWGSALGLWSTLRGVFAAVRQLLQADARQYPDHAAGVYRSENFAADAAAVFADLERMCRAGIAATAAVQADGVAQADSRSVRLRFDAALDLVDALSELPRQVLAGSNTALRLQRITYAQSQAVAQMLRLCTLSSLISVGQILIETYGEEMTAPELMYINRVLRQRVQREIDALRQSLAAARAVSAAEADRLYPLVHQCSETLRECAGQVNELVRAAINRKPPLIVRPSPLSGTVHQLAFALYGDIGRAPELVRLNPHITHPSFIRQGVLINGYAR